MDNKLSAFSEPSRLEVFFSVLEGYYLVPSFYSNYVDSLGLRGDERVLDYGSGPGALAVHVAKRLLASGGRLTCLDISKVWMTTIKKRLKKYPNVEFKLGSLKDLDTELDDASYDDVIIHFVLHHVEEPTRTENLRIISRKLKETGKVFVRDMIRVEHGIQPDEIRKSMIAAGLKELDFKMTKARFVGNMYEGVFGKKKEDARRPSGKQSITQKLTISFP